MIHMTETEQRADGSILWHCRCGASAEGFSDRNQAWRSGDQHLAQANGNARHLFRPVYSGDYIIGRDQDEPSCNVCGEQQEHPNHIGHEDET